MAKPLTDTGRKTLGAVRSKRPNGKRCVKAHKKHPRQDGLVRSAGVPTKRNQLLWDDTSMGIKRICTLEEDESLSLLSFSKDYCLIWKDNKRFKYGYGRFVRKNPSRVHLLESYIYDLSIPEAAKVYEIILQDFQRLSSTDVSYPAFYIEFLAKSVAGRCKYTLSGERIELVAEKFPKEYAEALAEHQRFVEKWDAAHVTREPDDWREFDASW